MKLLYILIIFILLFSCNINTKEDKIVKKKTKIEKKEVPDFQTMVEILHKNNFCSVIDTLNQFPGQPYVILFPQMHPVPKKLSVKEEQEILNVQAEMENVYNVILSKYNFSYYFESLQNTSNNISYYTDFSQHPLAEIISDLKMVNACLRNVEKIYGLQNRNLRAISFANRYLRKHINQFTKKYGYNEVKSSKKLQNLYVNELVADLSGNFTLPVSDAYASHAVFMNQIEKAVDYIKARQQKAPDSFYESYNEIFLKKENIKNTYTARQEFAINVLPKRKCSVMVYGKRHFQFFGSPRSLIKNNADFEYFEDILEEEGFNYILVKMNSLLLDG